MRSALFLAFERAGKSILAKIPIIAITTSSSINVNARAPGLRAQIMALRLVDDAPGRKERKRRRVRSEVAVRALVRTAGGPPPACAAEADSWCCRKNASAWRRPAVRHRFLKAAIAFCFQFGHSRWWLLTRTLSRIVPREPDPALRSHPHRPMSLFVDYKKRSLQIAVWLQGFN